MLKKLHFLLSIILICASMAFAYSGGPPIGVTGAPGDGTCSHIICHNDFELNIGDGTLLIGVPAFYLPGDTINISIDLADPGQQRWGFEITVLDSAFLPIGELIIIEPARTQISTGNGDRMYAKHTSTGTDNGTPNTAPGWSIKWAAPDLDVGPVTFYAAGNGANGNSSRSGDYIYTANATVDLDPSYVCCDLSGDANNDGEVNITDLTYTVDFMFRGGPPIICFEEGDLNGDCEQNISDLTYRVDFMFRSGPDPVDCHSCP